jgi:hypothetical protein
VKADDPLEDFAHREVVLHDVAKSVLSQPALPLNDPAGLEIAPEEIQAVRERLEREDLTVLAYRFEGDRFCRAERFAAYTEALGDRFIGRVLPDSAANADVPPFFAERVACPHSVVTVHLIDEAGQPTNAARDEILSFFARRLAKTSARGERPVLPRHDSHLQSGAWVRQPGSEVWSPRM